MVSYFEALGTQPEIITLNEAKEFLRIRASADDTLLTSLILAVTEWGQKYTNRQFGSRQFIGYFAGLKISRSEIYRFLTIRRSPLTEVSQVEIMQSGSYIAFTDYQEKPTSSFARLLFPGVVNCDPVPYPIKVSFTAGYEDVPEIIKTALKTHLSFLYENRGDAEPDGKIRVPALTKNLYQPVRIIDTW